MKILEKIFIAISLIGIFFKIQGYPGGSIILIIGLFFLSILYIAGLFFMLVDKTSVPITNENDSFEDSNLATEQEGNKRVYTPLQVVFSILGGLAFSVGVLGVLFKLQKYPGAAVMLLSGIFFISIVSIYAVLSFLKTKNIFSKRLTIRALIILLIVGALYLFPSRTIIEFQYRNNPELKAMHLEILENPDCLECKLRLNEMKKENK